MILIVLGTELYKELLKAEIELNYRELKAMTTHT